VKRNRNAKSAYPSGAGSRPNPHRVAVKSVDPYTAAARSARDEGDDDLAFHSRTLLRVGVRVAFEGHPRLHGLQAFNVTKLPPR
jgi:hypothetical protein